MAALRKQVHGLSAVEMAVFMDEVDLNLYAKVGVMLMWRGKQAVVVMPVTNEKWYHHRQHPLAHRAGLPAKGKPKEGRSAGLFLRHLDDLRRALRHYKVIHVNCDNARTHKPDKSKAVMAYLAEWSTEWSYTSCPRRSRTRTRSSGSDGDYPKR